MNLFKAWGNLKIGARLIIGFLIVVILTGVVGIVGINTNYRISISSDALDRTNDMYRSTLQARVTEKNFITTGDNNYIDEVKQHVADVKATCDEISRVFQ